MSEENKTEETTESGLKAKKVSLISKIVGGLFILGGFVGKSLGWFNCETNDLLKVGFSLVALCGTVDINIMLDKFTKKE